MFTQVDVAIAAAPVLPAYTAHPQYVGVLQWCSGPNLPSRPDEAQSVMFELTPFGVLYKKPPVFYFRAMKHQLSLLDCTKRAGDEAVLIAFAKLCDDRKVKMVYDTPFADNLKNATERQHLINLITQQFNALHEN